jgi:hypothetical protein
MNISQPDNWDQLYVELCMERVYAAAGDDPDTKVAHKHGFGTRQALYHRLRAEGIQLCEVCGTRTSDPSHCERRINKKSRRAKSTGEARELPPAADAAALFRNALGRLLSSVDWLSELKEQYRAGRFEASNIYRDPTRYGRKGFSEEQWRKICERYGQDPEKDSFTVYDETVVDSLGTTRSPRRVLAKLIGAYVIAGGSVEQLLEKLHPRPAEVDRGKLKEKVQALELSAEHVATLVRGGSVNQGPPTEQLSPREQTAAWYIYSQQQAGVSDAEIRNVLLDKRFTKDEITRLRKLRLSPPDSGRYTY